MIQRNVLLHTAQSLSKVLKSRFDFHLKMQLMIKTFIEIGKSAISIDRKNLMVMTMRLKY